MANKKKRVRRTKEQIAIDNAREQALIDMNNEFDVEAPSEGLGDTIAKFTKATGIDKIVKFIAGEDCRCDERRKNLNILLPYPVKCLNEQEYNFLNDFFSNKPTKVLPSQQIEMVKISRRIFNRNFEVSGCAGCVRDMVNRLETVYNEYEK